MMAESRIRAISENCLTPAMARHREVAENGIIFIRSNPLIIRRSVPPTG